MKIAKENKQIRDWKKKKKRRKEDQELSRKKIVELLSTLRQEGECHLAMKATIECETKRRREAQWVFSTMKIAHKEEGEK